MYWLVFTRIDRSTVVRDARGNPQVTIPGDEILPVGIFHADAAEDACKAAARKSKNMGTFFAIEGTPWGVDLLELEEGVYELGAITEDDEKERRLRALERSNLDRDVPVS